MWPTLSLLPIPKPPKYWIIGIYYLFYLAPHPVLDLFSHWHVYYLLLLTLLFKIKWLNLLKIRIKILKETRTTVIYDEDNITSCLKWINTIGRLISLKRINLTCNQRTCSINLSQSSHQINRLTLEHCEANQSS